MSAEFERFKAAHPIAVKAGLLAAANVYAAEVKQYLAHGYSTGEYAHGRAAESVKVTETFLDDGTWAVRVGSDVHYTLLWEMGFIHVGGKYERVEHWRFALDEAQPAMDAAFAEAYGTVMQSELG